MILLGSNVEKVLKERETSSSMERLFQEARVWLKNSEKLRKLDLIKSLLDTVARSQRKRWGALNSKIRVQVYKEQCQKLKDARCEVSYGLRISKPGLQGDAASPHFAQAAQDLPPFLLTRQSTLSHWSEWWFRNIKNVKQK